MAERRLHRNTHHIAVCLRKSDNGAQTVLYRLPQLGVGVGVCSYKGGRAPARTTPIRAYANHGNDDKKRDECFCTNYDCVIHALPIFRPIFGWLRLLKDLYACHGEDRGRGHQTRKPPAAKQWKRFEIDVEASTPTHEIYVRIAWSRSPRWFSRCPRIPSTSCCSLSKRAKRQADAVIELIFDRHSGVVVEMGWLGKGVVRYLVAKLSTTIEDFSGT